MAKVLVEVPDELMAAAVAAAGPGATKSSTIRAALQRSVDLRAQAELIDWMAVEDPLRDLRKPEVQDAATR